MAMRRAPSPGDMLCVLEVRASAWTGRCECFCVTGQETASYTYKQLYTTLRLSWKDYPAVTGAVAPSPTGGVRAGLRPTSM